MFEGTADYILTTMQNESRLEFRSQRNISGASQQNSVAAFS